MSRTGVIVVSHGEAALHMVQAAEKMVGTLNVLTVNVPIGESHQVTEQHLKEAVTQLETEEMVFLVDLEGSTPFKLCCRHCNTPAVVVTGMNLPMLFKLATADREVGALALAEELRATAVKSIHIRNGAPNP